MLKIITEKLKVVNFSENGLFLFVGVDEYDKEYINIITPTKNQVNTVFLYKCDSKFHCDELSKRFDRTLETSYLVLISGDDTLYYSYNGSFKYMFKINGLLIKRQKKGGSSAPRIGRLADESRMVYSGRIIDRILELKNAKSIWVFGSKEMKSMVLEKLSVRQVKTLDKFHDINVNFVNENVKELEELMEQKDNNNNKIVEGVLELIQTDPDILLFGNDITGSIQECEVVITTDQSKQHVEKYIVVDHNSKYFGRLSMYKSIGKRYFSKSCEEFYSF